jgi:hypothetical protein
MSVLPIFENFGKFSAFNFKDWRYAMTLFKTAFSFLSILLFCLFMTTGTVLAQPPGGMNGDQGEPGLAGEAPGDQQDGQRGRQRTQMSSEERQQRMAQRYQELLGMSDEEWAVIGPYVLKVSTLSSSSSNRGSAMRTLMGTRGNRTDDTGQDKSQDQRGRDTTKDGGDESLEALQTLLDDENATSGEIKTKLAALRKAREKSKQELIAAQRELRELLTLRQEATLVVMGLLE